MDKTVWHKDDERNIRYYTDLVGRYGMHVRALNWGSRESQRLRFSVLAQVGQLNGASILDIGCGTGDFFGWLKEAGIHVEYTGIDITPGMIDVARQRFSEAHFEVKNLLDYGTNGTRPYDYAIASGIFYYRQTQPFEFMKEMVTYLFRICNTAIAFNSLSAWATEKDKGDFYADPLAVLTFCRTLTPWITLRHDYHPRDFTIYLYKREQAR